MAECILEMENITKLFPGVKALDQVNLLVKRNQVHGLVGENGAGKSTLMKVLSGVYPHSSYSGNIKIDGTEIKFESVKDSEKVGIAIIYQELMLFPELTIAENITLPTASKLISRDKMHTVAKKWMDTVGLREDPETLVKNIGVGKQQLVEIAKALSLEAKILILDEPTAALTEKEIDNLMDLINKLRISGVTCIYISHKLDEVMRICDEVTVLRDGKTIETRPICDLDEKKIIYLMVGRDMSNRFPPKIECKNNEIAIEVKNFNMISLANPDRYLLKNINFHAKYGEILGIAGLMGAGRTELVNGIFGDFKGKTTCEILINNVPTKITCPTDAINNGIGLVTEDRKFNGLNLISSVEKNIVVASLDKFCKFGVIRENQTIHHADVMAKKTRIKTSSLEALVMNLSGGNQQKVVIAKWLMVAPKIMLFDEPTRGIDVGAKYEIYNLMNELKSQGIAIIMVSSELPEIIGMSDRVIVLCEGALTKEFTGDDMTEFNIIEAAT